MHSANLPSDIAARSGHVPGPHLLLGMGHRRKCLYRGGSLYDACTGELLHQSYVCSEKIEPDEYRVTLDTPRGQVRIWEDEQALWLQADGQRQCLSRSPVKLPRFDPHPHAPLLRALHAQLLVNIMPCGPVPNLWVYPRPWYRDSAMVMMCLEKTGNLALLEPWVMGLYKVFDQNNNGECEADNPGQLLYMVSLVSDRKHPVVEKVLREIKRFEKDGYILGRSDFAEHPVYQTKWMKYGLRSLGLDDPYRIPPIADSYDHLFWMDYREMYTPSPRFDAERSQLYPYLRWAEAHFFNEPAPATPSSGDPLLTWEGAASEADYWRMNLLCDEFTARHWCTPHTWHAAEMFLYYMQ